MFLSITHHHHHTLHLFIHFHAIILLVAITITGKIIVIITANCHQAICAPIAG